MTCNRTQDLYDICRINDPTIFVSSESTFLVNDPNSLNYQIEKVRPYARKPERYTMYNIREVTLKLGPLNTSTCAVHHTAPALVFSAGGGYTGNFFHDFNDVFIPLFITANSVFSNQDFVLVVSQLKDWWVEKYKGLLHSFSKHQIIDSDKDNSSHCFPGASIGLIKHGFMTINPKLIQTSKTLVDFHTFLATTYNKQILVPRIVNKPRLVLMSRNKTVGRAMLNEPEVERIAENVGFQVILFEPTRKTSLKEAFALVSSSHAMLGVHGAGLTHAMFLRPGSVFVQIIPIGAEDVSEYCYGIPARVLGLDYMEYKIKTYESSLVEKYGNDSKILNDPLALQRGGWPPHIMDIYLKHQDVRLDPKRLRRCLKTAYHKAKVFMDKNG
ncbi:unnamed protein product [Cuscuta europaea]|uniref:Glycosyltransferase 61 catalytic domain-containing protein n=1 Tax=Cuscuta europaea TaxID=41803 RepID=A0A9P1A321_CUSEU|nr:unnamed protein product [Cuscuta europaea]